MKKQLLFGFAAFAALAVTAQNSSRVITNPKVKKMVTFKPVTSAEPMNTQNSPVSHTNNKTAAAPYKRIGGSSNAFGVLVSETRALTYNANLNATGMVFRKQAGWTGVTGGNSGTIAYAYSTNPAVSWDSTVVAASTAQLHRYPTGGMYNPAGNTNPANAYAVTSGPWHPGANWQGVFFGSKQLTIPGNSTNGNVIYSDNLALSPTQRKQDFARTDFQITSNGVVHVLGGLYGDINGTTAPLQAYRGAALNSGTFNAGSFTWTVDSLKPNFKVDGVGDKIGYTQFNQAWSEDGVIGYVIFDGVDANALPGTSMNSYQPFVYKTVNSGASWSRFAPLFNFASIPSVGGRTYAANNGIAKPWISVSEGSSATVDASGNLHFLATFGSSSSDHIDSLGYTYNVDFKNTWNYITDFNTTANCCGGEWCATVIDSLHTDGPTDAQSNWTNGATGIGYDARLQISRTINGQKIIYSWADSDTNIVVGHLNTQPNIKMKGFDIPTSMYTATKDMSTLKVGADYNSFFFYTAPIIANPSAGNWLIPTSYTSSDPGTLDGLSAVSYYYMDDNIFTLADFNMFYAGSCGTVGIKNLTNTTFENLNFYPNPTSTNGTIDVQLNETAKLDITILNSVGQTVYSTIVNGNVGSNKVDVNLSNLSSGLYFYQVKVGNSKAITKKFAVEK